MVHVLSQDFDGRLNPVGFLVWHIQVIDEGDAFLADGRAVNALAALVEFALNDVLPVKESHHFYVTDPDRSCQQCATSWSPKETEYEGVRLKTTLRRSTTRIFGIHQSMWLDSSAQRKKLIDGVIEVASYLRKNEDVTVHYQEEGSEESQTLRDSYCMEKHF